jgi:hypothetical protein
MNTLLVSNELSTGIMMRAEDAAVPLLPRLTTPVRLTFIYNAVKCIVMVW